MTTREMLIQGQPYIRLLVSGHRAAVELDLEDAKCALSQQEANPTAPLSIYHAESDVELLEWVLELDDKGIAAEFMAFSQSAS